MFSMWTLPVLKLFGGERDSFSQKPCKIAAIFIKMRQKFVFSGSIFLKKRK